MTFLVGKALTDAMKRLVREPGKIKIAISYWGRHALTLLNLDTTKKNIVVLCCLKGGKSDPEVIKQFKTRARQCDRLHAKVLWTQNEAIVGSANASSNGMPVEDNFTGNLIEAGILITDRRQLKKIESWFDRYYGSQTLSRPIGKADLQAAEIARGFGWGTPVPGKRSLLAAMQEGGKREFQSQRIYFVMYRYNCTNDENRIAKRFLEEDAASKEGKLKIEPRDVERLTWYTDFYEIPNDAFIIDCYYRKNKIKTYGVYKTFPRNCRIQVDGYVELFTFALLPKYAYFSYKLTKNDKNVINRAAAELWKKGKGDSRGKVLSLLDAATTLLKHAEQ
jgi:hypothetical protein